jgi:phosphoglycolate phosphatase
MGICTTKRVDFAELILTRFGLRPYFAFVSGGDVGISKREQLQILLEQGDIGPQAVMIGDRAEDVAAARHNELRAIAVLWGHGSRNELLGAAPDRLLESPEELKALAGEALPAR